MRTVEKWSFIGSALKWMLLASGVGLLAGTASALFLYSLDAVSDARMRHMWLLYLLPLGGGVISYLYMKLGENSSKGNNLILEQINGGVMKPERIPLRMAPLVLAGTLTTHLFGGSAGREGTAVQMGGSLAESVGSIARIGPADRKILLMCGISAGFGSVFGTPLAGTVFGLEVAAIGLIRYEALLPCFIASLVGHTVAVSLWGVPHIHYNIGEIPALTASVLLKVAAASVLFGLTSLLFSEFTHFLKNWFGRLFKNPVTKSVIGGFVVITLVYIAGSRDYLGLGLPLIQQSFESEVSPSAFLWKLLFTSVTLGAGFQGGEVTPLFAIGAALGNALAEILELYAPFLAALGFIAVFCGAANTPIACFIMGVELFGSEGAIYMLLACIVSYLCSGHSGIYSSQQIGIPKRSGWLLPEGTTLASFRQHKRKKPE